MKWLAILFLTALLSFASTEASPERDKKSRIVGHEPRLVDSLDDIKASIKQLPRILAHTRAKSTLTLYEGLPHPTWYPEQFESELRTKKTITRYGFEFYDSPIEPSDEDTASLKRLLKKRKAFKRLSGFSGCGGFHPDFALVWKTKKSEVELQICFGCGEMRAYMNELEVYCQIVEIEEALTKILNNYHKQRPKPPSSELE